MDICNDDVRRNGVELCEGLVTARDGDDLVILVHEGQLYDLANRDAVVGQQYRFRHQPSEEEFRVTLASADPLSQKNIVVYDESETVLEIVDDRHRRRPRKEDLIDPSIFQGSDVPLGDDPSGEDQNIFGVLLAEQTSDLRK